MYFDLYKYNTNFNKIETANWLICMYNISETLCGTLIYMVRYMPGPNGFKLFQCGRQPLWRCFKFFFQKKPLYRKIIVYNFTFCVDCKLN